MNSRHVPFQAGNQELLPGNQKAAAIHIIGRLQGGFRFWAHVTGQDHLGSKRSEKFLSFDAHGLWHCQRDMVST